MELWRPSLTELAPPGLHSPALSVWWLFHHLRIFENRRYGVLAIYDGLTPIHRSVITPKWPRFPFMAKEDLQIGATWTHPSYRGRGLAVYAIGKVGELERRHCPRFWYLTEESNLASVRAAVGAGFSKYFEGSRTKRFGLRLFGAFIPGPEQRA